MKIRFLVVAVAPFASWRRKKKTQKTTVKTLSVLEINQAKKF